MLWQSHNCFAKRCSHTCIIKLAENCPKSCSPNEFEPQSIQRESDEWHWLVESYFQVVLLGFFLGWAASLFHVCVVRWWIRVSLFTYIINFFLKKKKRNGRLKMGIYNCDIGSHNKVKFGFVYSRFYLWKWANQYYYKRGCCILARLEPWTSRYGWESPSTAETTTSSICVCSRTWYFLSLKVDI